MANLSKHQLLHVVEDAIRKSGWNFLYLSTRGEHPARYHLYRNGSNIRVRIYIWNLTHGGKNRPEDEYRIQVTGIDSFEREIGGKTVILGWWNEVGVFAGFDYRRHASGFGASPSIQLREHALHQAALTGFAPHNKGSGELAIAFRPDFFGTYIENLESLHECGEAASDIEVLTRLGEDPDEVDEEDIEDEVSQPRRYAISSTKRALRDINFRDRVLTAYGHRCAMCALQLRLLDSAHILPAAHPNSTDQTRNGVALCTLHHRAYDRAFVTFDTEFRVHVNTEMVEELKVTGRDGGLEAFKKALRPILNVPPDKKDRPAAEYVETANALRGWPT